jgi:hypothetical protein
MARRVYEERILDLQVTYEARILNLQQHEARILQARPGCGLVCLVLSLSW